MFEGIKDLCNELSKSNIFLFNRKLSEFLIK